MCVQIWFNELEISVDRRQLLSEGEAPVSLFRCLYDSLVRCSCRPMRRPPLNTCCSQSVLGSWSSKLLWIPLRRRAASDGPILCCTWQSVLRSAGWLLLAAAVPLPYYIRLSVFYVFEEDEMEDRRTAVDRLELRYGFDHDLFQWLTPTHGVLLAVYVSYALSVLSVAALRRVCDAGRVDRLITDAVVDLRAVRHSMSARLLLAHFLLPLEKFGLVCGVVVGLVYWPVVMPLCLGAVLCYLVPLIYLTGRLLVHTRCACLSTLPLTTDSAPPASLSDGVTSFETCCFLDAISGGPLDDRCPDHVTPANKVSRRSRVLDTLSSLTIGLVFATLVWSLLLCYAEVVGFLVEIVVMTSVGVVLNSGSDAARRVVLFGWCVVYAAACYRAAVGVYTRFSRQVFAAVKRRLADQLLSAAALRQDRRRNTAFKYFSTDEIRRLAASMTAPAVDDVEVAMSPQLADDSIEYQSNLLHWNITSLSLLVDRRDTAHITRDLFARLCRLDVPGSPRSGVRVVLTALGRLLVATVFLLLLGLVVELSADAEVSGGGRESTGRTLVTLACGALPLILHAVFAAAAGRRRHGSELFCGKLERAVMAYTQSWPVFDLAFQRRDNVVDGSVTSRREIEIVGDQSCLLPLSDATEPKSVSPRHHHAPVDQSHVDLLITIRDDDDDDGVGDPDTGTRTNPTGVRPLTADGGSPLNQSPTDDEPVTVAPGSVVSDSRQSSSRRGRPRSVTADEGNNGASGSRKSGDSRVGFLLRKENSASTIPLRNQTRPEVVSPSTLVLDMVDGGDVTALTAGSRRSLPSHNDEDDQDCESAV